MAQSKRLWDYLGAITRTKDLSVLEDLDFDKVYTPFVINRALSQHEDSVLAANLMNERSWIPPASQFLFLLNTLRARFRKSDWLKKNTASDDAAVAEYYGCSLRHARNLVSLHSSDQMSVIYRCLDKGGATKKVSHAHPRPT